MPVNCSVPGCYNNSKKNPDVKFHSFPSDEELKYKWALMIKKGKPWGKPITPHTKVCSDHFDVSNYSPSFTGLSMVLSKNAIPSSLLLPKLKNERDTEAGSSEKLAETGSSKQRIAIHINAVRKTKRKTSVKDARNYTRDNGRWVYTRQIGQNGQKRSEMPNASDRGNVLTNSSYGGFMPVEVILQTYEDFDDLAHIESV